MLMYALRVSASQIPHVQQVRFHTSTKINLLRWGWVFLIFFTLSLRLISKTRLPHPILVAVIIYGTRFDLRDSKCRALQNKCFMRICYMFLISKCRGDWELGLKTTSGVAFREPLHNGKIRFFLRTHIFFFVKNPPLLWADVVSGSYPVAEALRRRAIYYKKIWTNLFVKNPPGPLLWSESVGARRRRAKPSTAARAEPGMGEKGCGGHLDWGSVWGYIPVSAQGAQCDCRCIPVNAQGDQWDCGCIPDRACERAGSPVG